MVGGRVEQGAERSLVNISIYLYKFMRAGNQQSAEIPPKGEQKCGLHRHVTGMFSKQ